MAQDRSFWSFAPQLVLRTGSVVLLLVSLGYLIYCSAKFGETFAAGYAVVCRNSARLFRARNLWNADWTDNTDRMMAGFCSACFPPRRLGPRLRPGIQT
jgi:hypothetical protein